MSRFHKTSNTPLQLLDRKNGAAFLALIGYGLFFMTVSFIGWPGSASLFSGQPTADDPLNPFMLSKNASFCFAFSFGSFSPWAPTDA